MENYEDAGVTATPESSVTDSSKKKHHKKINHQKTKHQKSKPNIDTGLQEPRHPERGHPKPQREDTNFHNDAPRCDEFTQQQFPKYCDQDFRYRATSCSTDAHRPVSDGDVHYFPETSQNGPTTDSNPTMASRCIAKKTARQDQETKQVLEEIISKFPKFGASSECKPALPRTAPEGTIEWAWFPDISWLKVLVWFCSFLIFLGFILVILSAVGSKTGLLVFGLLLMILGVFFTWFFHNWLWNASKQEAYKLARGKRVQALELWTEIDDVESYQAKDTFYESSYGGKTLRVLRDGTIEVHGYHKQNAPDDAGVASAMSSLKHSAGGMEVHVDM